METASHRRMFVAAATLMLTACGSGSGDSGTTSLPDAGSIKSANCSTLELGGLGIPAGTVASASGNSAQSLASNAIDGALATAWNSGTYSGWLRLDFPAPVAMTGVHIAASATPTASETYTITADGGSTPIGSATRQVTSGVLAVKLEAIPVTPGTYSSITVTVKGGLSWVQIQEISLVTSDCPVNPAGPGDAGNCDCSTRMCGDDGCGHSCGTCDPGETCDVAGECVS
jgi:hypothetical protein